MAQTQPIDPMKSLSGLDLKSWGRLPTLKVWEIAALQVGIDPTALSYETDEHGDDLDLSKEERILRGAVLTGDLLGYASDGLSSPREMEVNLASLIPWLRKRGYVDLADGLAESGQGVASCNRDSGLQAENAVGNSATAVPAVAPAVEKRGLSTREIAEAFDGVRGWTTRKWIKNLSSAQWLASSRMQVGQRGGASALWNPVTIAKLLHGKKVNLKRVQRAFRVTPCLGPWRADLDEYVVTHCVED